MTARIFALKGAVLGLAGTASLFWALSPGEGLYAAVLLSLGCGYLLAAILLDRVGAA